LPVVPAWRRYSIRFLLILTAVVAVGFGLWRALSYRHPAHANVLYQEADFTSGHRISVGPNVVSIRSIARNRYDGSIDVLKGPGLRTSIPQTDVLKKCSRWLDVVQVELEPGSERLGIVEVRVFHHQTRQQFALNEGLGWHLVEPNVVQIYGLGTEVPEQFDLWFRARSYPSDEVAILRPEVGSQATLAGGTVEVVDLADDFAGWDRKTGFIPGDPNTASGQSAVTIKWQGDWPDDDWRDIYAVTRGGATDFSFRLFNLQYPWNSSGPMRFDFTLAEIDHYEIRPRTDESFFFFDGLKVPPPQARKFDPPPTVTRPMDEMLEGVILEEFAPLKITARIYPGTFTPNYRLFNNVASDDPGPMVDMDTSFSLLLQEETRIYLPFDFHFRDRPGGNWRRNNIAAGNANSLFTEYGWCYYRIYHEPASEMQAVQLVPKDPATTP